MIISSLFSRNKVIGECPCALSAMFLSPSEVNEFLLPHTGRAACGLQTNGVAYKAHESTSSVPYNAPMNPSTVVATELVPTLVPVMVHSSYRVLPSGAPPSALDWAPMVGPSAPLPMPCRPRFSEYGAILCTV
jgi:hypothetical protein